MTITLPLPSAKLSPNARVHWRTRAALTKLHRQRAKFRTLEAAGLSTPPAFAGYSLAFHWPNDRRRDDDNAEASTKAYRDGIADALHLDDFNLPKLSVSTFRVDREKPRLEITLHPSTHP
jgi:crossover junction endodeoxyribonuclease RusA